MSEHHAFPKQRFLDIDHDHYICVHIASRLSHPWQLNCQKAPVHRRICSHRKILRVRKPHRLAIFICSSFPMTAWPQDRHHNSQTILIARQVASHIFSEPPRRSLYTRNTDFAILSPKASSKVLLEHNSSPSTSRRLTSRIHLLHVQASRAISSRTDLR